MSILVVDIGGNNVKLKDSDHDETVKFPSGAKLTAQQLVDGIREHTEGWQYDRITLGYPGPVVDGKILLEPVNLGKGWLGFDFGALGKPYKLLNDAAMQAVGSYEGGRMLFLGLGTGLGSTLIINGTVCSMELGHLPYKKKTFEDYIGTGGLEKDGKKEWIEVVHDVVARLKAALVAEYVVLGGGNVKKLKELPPDCRRGSNKNAFAGGVRLWEDESAFRL